MDSMPVAGNLSVPPTAADLAAYRRGSLDLARFDAIDAWLAAQPEEVQERLLAGDEDAPSRPLAIDLPLAVAAPFTSEGGAERYVPVGEIGRGGMGIVQVVRDVTLGREVAMKTCRPRAIDEDLGWHLRLQRAFRREAAVTAQLEHPAIVPVHDLGRGPAGEPAYIMKRLVGKPLSQRVDRIRAGARIELSETIEIMLRIAEAMAHAHAKGIVHRDLKPENVFAGQLGEVSVIDWGLAGQRGEAPAAMDRLSSLGSGFTRFGAGTTGWLAPEQERGAPADPRMDVFALGGLLMALLTGCAPRRDDGTIDLSPLQRRGVPRGLGAVATRCLAREPAERYEDGAAVAGELRRWLSEGLTLAERPSWPRRAWALLRTSPRLSGSLVLVVLLTVAALGSQWLSHRQHRREMDRRLVDLAQTSLTDLSALHLARSETRAALAEHTSTQAMALDARFAAAIETIERQQETQAQRERLRSVFTRYRERGQHPSDTTDLTAALHEAGLTLQQVDADARVVRDHPLRLDLLEALVHLEKNLILDAPTDPRRAVIPRVIAAGGPNEAWRAIGQLLERTQVDAHDLRFCQCEDSEVALRDPNAADVLLMTYGPDQRLIDHARDRLREDPGAFWPRITSARGSLRAGRADEAREHALVALGSESKGFWPNLLLAYAALSQSDQERLESHVAAGLAANPGQLELVALQAVALARAGQMDKASALVADPAFAAHLQYHLQHPVGHPMEESVKALVDAGVHIPDAAPAIGPLVPEGSPHHH